MKIDKYLLKEACSIIFGSEILNKDCHIDSVNLKHAFRKVIKQSHPDMANLLGINEKNLEIKFRQVQKAYDVLQTALKEHNKIIIKNPIHTENNTSYYKTTKNDHQSNYKNKNNKRTNYNDVLNKKSFYYDAEIPKRKLRFAEYLFYSKRINWNILINSIVWQYQNRPRFGEIARELGYINTDSLLTILKNSNNDEKIGDAGIRLNVIDNFQRYVILGKQRQYNCMIGQFFTENNIFTEKELIEFISEQDSYNKTFRNNQSDIE